MLIRILLVGLLGLPFLGTAQNNDWNATLTYDRRVGQVDGIAQYRGFGVMVERRLLVSGRWSFGLGLGLSQETQEIVNTDGGYVFEPPDRSVATDELLFTARSVSTALILSSHIQLNRYAMQLSFFPEYFAAGQVGISHRQEDRASYARTYSATFGRRLGLEASIGISRTILENWSIGLAISKPLLPSRVDFRHDTVVCPFMPPCFTIENPAYNTLSLKQSTLSLRMMHRF